MILKDMAIIAKPKRDLQTEQLKVPPHSLEAEQAVLGGLMLDGNAWDQIADFLQAEDFYRQEHRLIYQAMSELSNRQQPLDVLTITEILKERSQLEQVGGEVYLFEIARNTPSAANIVAYTEIVRERSVLRKLIAVASEMATNAFQPNGRETKELLDEAERQVFAIAERHVRGAGPVKISKLLTQATEKIDKLFHSDSHITGLSTGFIDFDEMTTGLQHGDLVIVAGRPSMGKTAFAMNMVENVAIRSQQPVLVFSMEMPGEQLAMRMMSSLGQIDQHKVRTGKLSDDDWLRLSSAVSLLSGAKLFIDDTPALSPSEVRARARRLAKEYGQLGLIVIDYLQLMSMPGYKENRTLEISEISRNLKALAKELNVPVIALSQLNRSLEQRHDRRPVMSDLRESGAIEQDADLIVFIYRDEVYNPETPDKGIAEIIIAKQRNGPIGKVRLAFFGRFTRFDNLAGQSYQYESNA